MRGEPETKSPRVEEKEFAAGQEIARSPQGKISYVTCSMPNYRVFDTECDNTYRHANI